MILPNLPHTFKAIKNGPKVFYNLIRHFKRSQNFVAAISVELALFLILTKNYLSFTEGSKFHFQSYHYFYLSVCNNLPALP